MPLSFLCPFFFFSASHVFDQGSTFQYFMFTDSCVCVFWYRHYGSITCAFIFLCLIKFDCVALLERIFKTVIFMNLFLTYSFCDVCVCKEADFCLFSFAHNHHKSQLSSRRNRSLSLSFRILCLPFPSHPTFTHLIFWKPSINVSCLSSS